MRIFTVTTFSLYPFHILKKYEYENKYKSTNCSDARLSSKLLHKTHSRKVYHMQLICLPVCPSMHK